MSKNKVTINIGSDIGGVLFIVFLIFKLTGVITWSWWWVFAPLWIPIIFCIIILLIYIILN